MSKLDLFILSCWVLLTPGEQRQIIDYNTQIIVSNLVDIIDKVNKGGHNGTN